jgi:hypothetical protein
MATFHNVRPIDALESIDYPVLLGCWLSASHIGSAEKTLGMGGDHRHLRMRWPDNCTGGSKRFGQRQTSECSSGCRAGTVRYAYRGATGRKSVSNAPNLSASDTRILATRLVIGSACRFGRRIRFCIVHVYGLLHGCRL